MRGGSEEVIKRTGLLADPQAGTRLSENPHHFPVLGMYIPPIIPIAGAISRMILERTRCCCNMDEYVMNPVKACTETFKFPSGRCGDLLVLKLPKTSLIGKVPCLLDLPPTNLGWPASFLDFLLPSMYTASFRFHPGNSEVLNQHRHSKNHVFL